MRLRGRLVVPKVPSLKWEICDKAHKSRYTVYPGNSKMYQNLKRNFWWKGLKRYIANYVSKYVVCKQVKIEYQILAEKLQPLPIPKWKWEHITMDSVDGLPMTKDYHDRIWVVVDCITKLAHFLSVRSNYSVKS